MPPAQKFRKVVWMKSAITHFLYSKNNFIVEASTKLAGSVSEI